MQWLTRVFMNIMRAVHGLLARCSSAPSNNFGRVESRQVLEVFLSGVRLAFCSQMKSPSSCLPFCFGQAALLWYTTLPATHKLLSDIRAITQCLISHFMDMMIAVHRLLATCFVAALSFFGREENQQVLAEFMSGFRHALRTLAGTLQSPACFSFSRAALLLKAKLPATNKLLSRIEAIMQCAIRVLMDIMEAVHSLQHVLWQQCLFSAERNQAGAGRAHARGAKALLIHAF